MTSLVVAHTADLGAADRALVRALLDDSFADFTEDDHEHTLGGVHALVRRGDDVVAHGAVVMRRLVHSVPGSPDRVLRAGYVEGVAVRSSERRHGHGGTVMAALERVIRAAYDIGALGASDAGVPFYAARGWRRWEGTTSVLAPDGRRRTPEDDGGVWLLPGGVPVDGGDLACDWRAGDVW